MMTATPETPGSVLEALDTCVAILSTLDRPRDVLQVGCVNTVLRDAVNENLLWHTVRSLLYHRTCSMRCELCHPLIMRCVRAFPHAAAGKALQSVFAYIFAVVFAASNARQAHAHVQCRRRACS